MASSNSIADARAVARSCWYAARVALALSVASGLIRCLGVRRAVAMVLRLADRFPTTTPPTSEPMRVARLLSARIGAVALRMPVVPTCLPRSLLLAGALRRHGVPGVLCVGVAGIDDFSAHAWVELGGVALHEAPDIASRFRPIWCTAVLTPPASPR